MRRIGTREAAAAVAGAGLEFFTPDDLAQALGIPRQRAMDIAARMADVNLARRVKRGLYALLPPAEWGNPAGFAVDWHTTAAQLMADTPYFLGYYTAMSLHQMIQHPLRTVFVATTERRRNRRIGPVTFRFITLTRRRFFGFDRLTPQGGTQVQVAHLERTFVDCVDRPRLCGGLDEIVSGYRRRLGDLNRDRLLAHVQRLDDVAATRRLGFLLELVGYRYTTLLWDLEEFAANRGDYVPLTPGQLPGGPRNRRWRLDLPPNIRRLADRPVT